MDANKIIAKAIKAIEILIEETFADELDTITFLDCEKLSNDTGVHVGTIVNMVKSYGLRVGPRAVPKEVRGFRSNSHDRWYGKGSCNSHGGSGAEQITGFAGIKG